MIYTNAKKPKKHYDIQPCPFCGEPGILERNQRAFIDGKTTRVALVRCSLCGARAGRYKLSDYGRTSHSDEAERAAVKHWNSRVFLDEKVGVGEKENENSEAGQYLVGD